MLLPGSSLWFIVAVEHAGRRARVRPLLGRAATRLQGAALLRRLRQAAADAGRQGADRTEYVLAAIPLGGYVKLLDEREGGRTARSCLAPSRASRPGSASRCCSPGPAFNILFAILVLWAMYLAKGATETSRRSSAMSCRQSGGAAWPAQRATKSWLDRWHADGDPARRGLRAARLADRERSRCTSSCGQRWATRAASLDVADSAARRRLTAIDRADRALPASASILEADACRPCIGRLTAGGPARRPGLQHGRPHRRDRTASRVADFTGVYKRHRRRASGRRVSLALRARQPKRARCRSKLGESERPDGKAIGLLGIAAAGSPRMPASMLVTTPLGAGTAFSAASRKPGR